MGIYLSVSPVVKRIDIGVEGQGFDSRTGDIGRSVTEGSPPLRRFLEVLLSKRSAAEMGPATRSTLWRNITSTFDFVFESCSYVSPSFLNRT